MNYTPVHSFLVAHKGKHVRFKAAYTANNLSQAFGLATSVGPVLKINPGAVGLIYEVRGGTLFIGFQKDLKTPPPKSTFITRFAATMDLHINDSHKIEIEQ